MNSKKIFGLVIGASIGGVIGWLTSELLVYQLIEKPQEKLLYGEDLIDSEEIIEQEGYAPPEKFKVMDVSRNNDIRIIKNYAEVAKQNHPLIVSESDPDLDNVTPVEDIEEDVEDEAQITQRVITEEEWLDSPLPTTRMTYYAHDKVLTLEDDSIVEYRETLIGFEALDSFGEGTQDPDTVFVYNEDEKMNYEISRINGAYSELVLGEPKVKVKKPSATKADITRERLDEEEHGKRKSHAKKKSDLIAAEEDD